MNSTKERIIKKLEDIYLLSGYMDRYGLDVWTSFILCISFFIMIYYYHLANIIEGVRTDWDNQKCNPLFMPFAGFINKPTNKTNFEFTSENFTNCIQFTLKSVSLGAFNPFQKVILIIKKAIQNILDAINLLRALLDRIKRAFHAILRGLYAITINLTLEFQDFIIKLRDVLGKINGILITILYFFFGVYMTIQTLFLSIVDFLTLILIAIAVCIVLYISISMGLISIPFIGPALAAPTIVVGIVTTIIMIIILVLVLIFNIFMMRVLDLSTPPLPSVPSCFAGLTLIPLFNGQSTYIKNIRIGDKLQNGSIVTATMQFSAAEQNIYFLNGVMVTGEHRVFHPTLYWIKVKDHPDSLYLPDFEEPYVYCLNTDTKAFGIADTLFSDWDDIDRKVWNNLRKNCAEYLPLHFIGADIHTYLDSGFQPDTKIKLNNGAVISIREVKINDILWDNTKVLGIITIAGHDITQYKHTFANGASLTGTKNIHINDHNLGTINCMSLESIPTAGTPLLYHLLTDTKFFVANAIKVHDYNYGIDAYLNEL